MKVKFALSLLALSALTLYGCSGSKDSNDKTKQIEDSKAINSQNLWPKPENPVAPESERNKNIAVVQKFFQAYGKGDVEGIKEVMHENVEWYIPGRHVLSGTKRGINDVVAFFNSLQKAGFRAEVMILAANDDYVIDAHRGWSNTGKEDIDLNWILIYQVENGKIRRVQNFSGDVYSSDEFFNRFYSK